MERKFKLKPESVPSIFVNKSEYEEVVESTPPVSNKRKVKKQPRWMVEVPYCVVNQCTNDVMDLAKGVAFFRYIMLFKVLNT